MAPERAEIHIIGEMHLVDAVMFFLHALIAKSYPGTVKKIFLPKLGRRKTLQIIDLANKIDLPIYDQLVLDAWKVFRQEYQKVKSLNPDLILVERPQELEHFCESFNRGRISAEDLVEELYSIREGAEAIKEKYGPLLANILQSETRFNNIGLIFKAFKKKMMEMFSKEGVRVHCIDIPKRDERIKELATESQIRAFRAERESYMAARTNDIIRMERPRVVVIITGKMHEERIEENLEKHFGYRDEDVVVEAIEFSGMLKKALGIV
ncbi:MAG: hypothetical protein ACE5J7_01135 [Candidatus Aenigmatarchaeota archaeon]